MAPRHTHTHQRPGAMAAEAEGVNDGLVVRDDTQSARAVTGNSRAAGDTSPAVHLRLVLGGRGGDKYHTGDVVNVRTTRKVAAEGRWCSEAVHEELATVAPDDEGVYHVDVPCTRGVEGQAARLLALMETGEWPAGALDARNIVQLQTLALGE